MSRLRHSENGQALDLTEGQVYYVGRNQLGVTDKRVSRHQLQLSLRGPALAVTVEGVNPVYIRRAGKELEEQELLARGEEAILRPGDVVTLLADSHPLVFEHDEASTDGHSVAGEQQQADGTSLEPKESKKRKCPSSDDDIDYGSEGNDQESRVKFTNRESAPKRRLLSDEEELERRSREQREEAAHDEAEARKLMEAARLEIEMCRKKQEEADRRLAAQLEREDQAEHQSKRRIVEDEGEHYPPPSTSSSTSRGHGGRGRGRGIPARRKAGGRHAARVAKEKMNEYLELVDQATEERKALGEEVSEDDGDADRTPEHDPFNSDAFDAAEWKKRADDSSGDEENVSEGSGDEDCEGGEKPACKYGAQCYRRNPDHIKRFYHPPRE